MPRETFSLEQLEMLDTNVKQLIMFFKFRGSQKVLQLLAQTEADYKRWMFVFNHYATNVSGQTSTSADVFLPKSVCNKYLGSEDGSESRSRNLSRRPDDSSPTSITSRSSRLAMRGDSESPVRRTRSWKQAPLLLETLRQGRIVNPRCFDDSAMTSSTSECLSPVKPHRSQSRFSSMSRSVSSSFWQDGFCNESEFDIDFPGGEDEIALDGERLGQLRR
jgi:hypothetical protein